MWSKVTKKVRKYVESCDVCQRIKNRIEILVRKLMTNEVLEKLWMYLTVDFIMKLLIVAGKNAILVVYDRLFKMTHFVTPMEGISTEGLARLFRDNMWKLYRLPESMISNRGLQFAAELMKKLNKMFGIEIRLLILFHPQIDGQMKQMNQELEQYLRFFIKHR